MLCFYEFYKSYEQKFLSHFIIYKCKVKERKVDIVYFKPISKLKFHECACTYYLFCIIIFQASTIDGRRKGACLFCQEYFMDLYLLAELKTISLKVTTVDMQKPPPDFR